MDTPCGCTIHEPLPSGTTQGAECCQGSLWCFLRRCHLLLLLLVRVCRTPYRLARYNEPWQPLPFRRNEVLIDLQDFRWI